MSVTEAEYRAAVERGIAENEVIAVSARFDARRARMVVELSNGVVIAFPPDLAQGLAGAPPAALRRVQIVGAGTGLHWPLIDADLHVQSLAAGVFGTRAWMTELARSAGKVRSPAKARAARKNGRLGGRPRKRA